MEATSRRRMSVEEYIALEEGATERHEYWDGQVFAMSASSPRQNDIVVNLAASLLPGLKAAGCKGLVEVLSPTTERRDRTFKLDQYRTIPSVRQVVLISQSEVRVESYRPIDAGWHLKVLTNPAERLVLPVQDVSTGLAEIYDGIELDPPTVPQERS